MYLCRTLSYEGAEFEVIEAPLEEKMTVHKIYLLLYTGPVIFLLKKQWKLSGKKRGKEREFRQSISEGWLIVMLHCIG